MQMDLIPATVEGARGIVATAALGPLSLAQVRIVAVEVTATRVVKYARALMASPVLTVANGNAGKGLRGLNSRLLLIAHMLAETMWSSAAMRAFVTHRPEFVSAFRTTKDHHVSGLDVQVEHLLFVKETGNVYQCEDWPYTPLWKTENHTRLLMVPLRTTQRPGMRI